MRKNVSLREALSDPKLLDSWAAWRTILIAAMGEELTSEERELFAKLTGGRDHEPGGRWSRCCSSSPGVDRVKSRALSVLASYLVCDWSEHLFIGEVGALLSGCPPMMNAFAGAAILRLGRSTSSLSHFGINRAACIPRHAVIA
jgi:hypothetical protein